MEDIGYLDFDLQIERAGQGYRVNVLSSPAGQASSDFALPFSDLELENFILRMSRTRRATRRLGTPELEAARTFGGRLYEAVFSGEVRGCLRSSLDAAGREGRGLRLRLRPTETPELVDIPWEYLYSPALNRFFALSNATPLVRYLDLPEPVAPLAVQPPLRLLALIASPRDFPALDVEQEWLKLRAALKELEDAGRITVERLESPTLSALQRRLRAGPCHILHFIGHGTFDEATQDGQLALEDRDGRGHVVSAQDLGVLLHDHHTMRLVVLNSCEGARTSRTDPFAGAAQSLVQQGMPAVIAMQFEISDDAAIVIGHEFYSALASGYPVDAALAEARKAAFTSASGAEWGTPVLYLRAPDGRIFGIDTAPSAAPVAAAQAPAPLAPAPSARGTKARGLLQGRKALLALAGVIAVLALAFGLTRLVPALSGVRGQQAAATDRSPGAGAAVTRAGTAEVTPAPAKTLEPGTASVQATSEAGAAAAPTRSQVTGEHRSIDQLVAENPRVLSSTAWVHELAAAEDGVWAATSGGLVRWKGDGTSKVFTSGDGLPFSHTRAILAMPDGSIWAGGNYAIVHFRPAGDALGELERYSDAEGVDIGEQPFFMLDTDGSAWVTALYGDAPVLRFDGTLWRPPDLPTDDPALQGVKPQFSAATRGKDGALWIALLAGGLLRWDGHAWTRFGTEQGLPEKESVTRLLEDSRGALWASAGPSGLLRLDRQTGVWKKIEFQRPDAPVFWISELPDKSLWASGDNFIFRSDDGERWRLVATPEDGLYFPTSVVQDGMKRVWAATGDGLATYDGSKWRILRRPGEPQTSNMGKIVPDPDGKLWVVPEYGGRPSVIDPATGLAIAPPQALPQSLDIISLAFGDGATWAGTSAGLLRLKDNSLKWFQPADGLPNERIGALLATTSTLWIGTSQGLATLDFATGRITGTVDELAGQKVYLLASADDAVWAASSSETGAAKPAVHRIAGSDHQSWPNDEAPLNGNQAEALEADEAGRMWVGSDSGAFRWDGQRWMGWAEGQGAPAGDIYAIIPQGGAMWISGHSWMIDRWDDKNGWRRIRPKGVTGDVLDMHLSDDGALWLATQDGLLHYGP